MVGFQKTGHTRTFQHHYEFSKVTQLTRARRQNLLIPDYCGITRVWMDPLAVLGRDSLGNGPGNRVCAALSAAVEIDASKAHTCRAHYIDDHPHDSDSAANAGRRVIAAGRVQSVREDPVGRVECR